MSIRRRQPHAATPDSKGRGAALPVRPPISRAAERRPPRRPAAADPLATALARAARKASDGLVGRWLKALARGESAGSDAAGSKK